jgi:hypothetical protein
MAAAGLTADLLERSHHIVALMGDRYLLPIRDANPVPRRPDWLLRRDRLNEARVIVLDVADPRTDRPTRHKLWNKARKGL